MEAKEKKLSLFFHFGKEFNPDQSCSGSRASLREPVCNEREASLNGTPVRLRALCSHSFTPWRYLVDPLTCRFLGGERKPENLKGNSHEPRDRTDRNLSSGLKQQEIKKVLFLNALQYSKVTTKCFFNGGNEKAQSR